MISGTTCANCKVNIYRAMDNPAAARGGGTYLGYVNANASGVWSVDLSTLSGGTGLTRSDIALLTWDATFGSSEMSPRPVIYLPAVIKGH